MLGWWKRKDLDNGLVNQSNIGSSKQKKELILNRAIEPCLLHFSTQIRGTQLELLLWSDDFDD